MGSTLVVEVLRSILSHREAESSLGNRVRRTAKLGWNVVEATIVSSSRSTNRILGEVEGIAELTISTNILINSEEVVVSTVEMENCTLLTLDLESFVSVDTVLPWVISLLYQLNVKIAPLNLLTRSVTLLIRVIGMIYLTMVSNLDVMPSFTISMTLGSIAGVARE